VAHFRDETRFDPEVFFRQARRLLEAVSSPRSFICHLLIFSSSSLFDVNGR
jgi:hypothetical protein